MKESQSSGITFLSLLGIVFVTLKLLGVINWSWWWVTLPFWGVFPLAVLIMLAIVVVLIYKTWRK